MRKFTLVLGLSLFFSSFSSVALAAEKRNKLEELLIWKISDELKLNIADEQKFSEIIRDINSRKAKYNHELQDSVEKVFKASTVKAKDAELVLYRKSLQNFSRLNEEEFDRLIVVFGAERMAQYLHIKQDLTNRIKGLLITPEVTSGGEKKPLPQPKLIEEK